MFRYVSDPESGLAKDLDGHISSGQPVTPRILDQLRTNHRLPPADSAAFHDLGSGLGRQVSTVQQIIDAGFQRGTEFSHEVSGIADGLGRSKTRHSVIRYAEELLRANRVLLAKMGRMTAGLTTTRNDVSRLEKELEHVRQNANTDHLTGLENRRKLDGFLSRQIAVSDPAAGRSRSMPRNPAAGIALSALPTEFRPVSAIDLARWEIRSARDAWSAIQAGIGTYRLKPAAR